MDYKFNPRLYPGSARFATFQTSDGQQNTQSATPACRSSVSSLTAPLTCSPVFNSFNPPHDFAFRRRHASLLSLPFVPLERQNSAIRISPPQSTVAQAAVPETPDHTPVQEDLHLEPVVKEASPYKASLQDNLSLLSSVSTSRYVPLQEFGVTSGIDVYHTSPSSPSDSSTDLSTISSTSSHMLPCSSPMYINERKCDLSVSIFASKISRWPDLFWHYSAAGLDLLRLLALIYYLWIFQHADLPKAGMFEWVKEIDTILIICVEKSTLKSYLSWSYLSSWTCCTPSHISSWAFTCWFG